MQVNECFEENRYHQMFILVKNVSQISSLSFPLRKQEKEADVRKYIMVRSEINAMKTEEQQRKLTKSNTDSYKR